MAVVCGKVLGANKKTSSMSEETAEEMHPLGAKEADQAVDEAIEKGHDADSSNQLG